MATCEALLSNVQNVSVNIGAIDCEAFHCCVSSSSFAVAGKKGVVLPSTKQQKGSVSTIVACFSGISTIGMLGVGAFDKLAKNEASAGWFIGAALLSVADVIVRVASARKADAEVAHQESPHDLRGCLEVLIASLCLSKGINFEDNNVRTCIWKVVEGTKKNPESDMLEQITEYVGGSGGPAGRKQSAKMGVIGKCARLNESARYSRHSEKESEFKKELVVLGFSNKQADQVSKDRWSFLAVPIFGGNANETIGVIYFDSPDKEFFDDSTTQNLIELSSAISRYINDRYAK